MASNLKCFIIRNPEGQYLGNYAARTAHQALAQYQGDNPRRFRRGSTATEEPNFGPFAQNA